MAREPKSATRVKRTARHYEVSVILQEEIRTGRYAVGDKFLTESEVCERFGVSRFTAREALRRLVTAGLIERRQGSGTRVVSRTVDIRYVVSVSNEASVLRYTHETVLVPRDGWAAAARRDLDSLELDAGRSWVALDAMRRGRRDGNAVSDTTIFVDGEYADELDTIDVSSAQPIFLQLAERRGLQPATIDHEIYALALGATQARRLGVASGSPGLAIVRRYVAPGVGCYEVSRSIHPAERFRYRLSLTNAASLP